MKKWMFLCLLATTFSAALPAQDIAFSQFFNTPMITNPADLGVINDIRTTLSYRNQPLYSGQSFISSNFNFSYPMFNRKGQQTMALGFGLITDEAANYMATVGLMLAGSYTIPIDHHQLSFGVQAGLFNRQLGNYSLSTISQYQGGVYDPSLPNMENFNRTVFNLPSFAGGVRWTFNEARKNGSLFEKGHIGFSMLNINEPVYSFVGGLPSNGKALPTRFQLTAGYGFGNETWMLMPSIRGTYYRGVAVLQAGGWLKYDRYEKGQTIEIAIGSWYHSNQYLTAALQCRFVRFLFTASYDFPLTNTSRIFQHNGVIEMTIGIAIKRKKLKNRRGGELLFKKLIYYF